ncbi:FlgO family outer membrane protein [Maribacter sp. 2304DJ31-5]|uniref:FlgO family outer membrane protein n=1 Tax=Maribacter sp. 2304DJ31-5 TaxID=3386273 RepID=UPI0039BD89F2
MKIKALLYLLITLPMVLQAQDFDDELKGLAEELAQRIDVGKKTKIAVWGFFSEKNEQTHFGNYLTEDFAIYLANHAENFAMIDRTHLNIVLKEHRLNTEGYIDEKTTKRLGKILAADALVIGTYTIFDSEIKVRAKVLDTETALQFAGTIGTLSMDENIAKLLGKL